MENLTKTQVDELSKDMEILREEIGKAVESARAGSKPVDLGLPIGRLSRMDALQRQHMAQAGAAALERRLGQITAALAASASGAYGLCQRCEEPIGYKRLKARPETPFVSVARRNRRSGADAKCSSRKMPATRWCIYVSSVL